MSNMPFDLDAFIAGVNQDKTQPKASKDGLQRILMNTRKNQGTLTFIPVYSNALNNFYLKIPRVYEYNGYTSLLPKNEDGTERSGWYRVLPLDMYGELTQEQMELYHEVKSMLDVVNDDELADYDEFRVRNYSLFYGIALNLVNTEKNKVEEVVNNPCLFVYPSAKVIDSFCDAINNKIDIMGGRKEWLTYILSTSSTGRKGVIQVSFTKSSGAGYDTSVAFEFNSELNIVVDPNYVIPEDHLSKFDDILPTFLGWNYDYQNKSLFRTEMFKELRDQLKLFIKGSNQPEPKPADATRQYPNMNNLQSSDAAPMPTATPTPVPNQEPISPAGAPRRPF